MLAEIKERGSARNHELPLKTKSNETRLFSVNIDLVDIDGQKYILNTTKDITEQKRAEQERDKLIERLDLATHAAQMGIWDWDIQKNKLVWDDQMYKLYGLQPGDFGGAYEAWLNGLHPDDRKQSDEASQMAVRGEKEYDTEFRVLWPDGSIHWLKATGQVFRDQAGNPLRMVGINYDITAHQQSEKQIVQMKRLYATLSQVNQTIVRIKDHEDLYQSICDVSTKFGEFPMAWVGL